MTTANYVYSAEALYVAFFGRPADVGGLSNFSDALAKADTTGTATTAVGLARAAATVPAVAALVNSFGSSAESTALYHGSASDIVDAVYHNLYNRAPDASGKAFWVNAINTGQLSASQAALHILAGAQGSDITTANNKIAAATLFSNAMAADTSGAFSASFAGAAAAADARGLLSTVGAGTNVNSAQFKSAIHATLDDIVMENNVHASVTLNIPDHMPGYVNIGTSVTVNNAPVIAHLDTNQLLHNDRIFFAGWNGDVGAYHLVGVSQAQVDSTTAAFGHAGNNGLADYIATAIEVGDVRNVTTFNYGGNTYLVNQVTDHSLTGATIVELSGVHNIAGPSGAFPGFYVW